MVERVESWRGYDKIIKKFKNILLQYLELLYKIINIALDTAQLWEDWDRQSRLKIEKDVRAKLNELKKQKCKIDSVKLNVKKGMKQ